jgi:hypothetical protein
VWAARCADLFRLSQFSQHLLDFSDRNSTEHTAAFVADDFRLIFANYANAQTTTAIHFLNVFMQDYREVFHCWPQLHRTPASITRLTSALVALLAATEKEAVHCLQEVRVALECFRSPGGQLVYVKTPIGVRHSSGQILDEIMELRVGFEVLTSRLFESLSEPLFRC